jgi:hypothetical protein
VVFIALKRKNAESGLLSAHVSKREPYLIGMMSDEETWYFGKA